MITTEEAIIMGDLTAEIVKYLVTGLGSIAAFYAVNTLAKIDRNQERITDKLNGVETRMTIIETEHNLMKGRCTNG
jgi:hypothetical protein